MIKQVNVFLALLLAMVMLFSLSACGNRIYYNDDTKKSYDKKYEPTVKSPSELTKDEETAIKTAAADIVNKQIMSEYEDAMQKYNDAVLADALAREADSSKAAEAEKNSSQYISTYTPAELTEPETPEAKTMDDVSFYTYGGTYNGYIAIKYKVRGRAVVVAHQVENLTEDIIGNYNFSYYADSPNMSLFKDGTFYTIREVYESGGITDANLKDIWYYFYVKDN